MSGSQRAYLTECIGTFFLVFTIGLTVPTGSPFAPFAIGLALMAMVYAGGHHSGAHFNPAVTVAMYMRGALSGRDILPYMAAQLLGALAAAAAVLVITGGTFAPAPGVGVGTIPALLVEIIYTFALALVILNVAVSRKTHGNMYYGLAIGVSVAAFAFAGGGISGGAFNPAVGLGPITLDVIAGHGTWRYLWLYIVGPLIGAVAAAVVFGWQEPATV